MNVNKDAAPGMMHYLDEIGKGSYVPGPPRLTPQEVADLKAIVAQAYTNSRT